MCFPCVCDHTDVLFRCRVVCKLRWYFNEKQKMEVSPGRRRTRKPTAARRRRRRNEANVTAKTAESPANRVPAGLLLSWTYSPPPLPPPRMPRVGSYHSLAPIFQTKQENDWHTAPLSRELSPRNHKSQSESKQDWHSMHFKASTIFLLCSPFFSSTFSHLARRKAIRILRVFPFFQIIITVKG